LFCAASFRHFRHGWGSAIAVTLVKDQQEGLLLDPV
jgi:hypothetical protein